MSEPGAPDGRGADRRPATAAELRSEPRSEAEIETTTPRAAAKRATRPRLLQESALLYLSVYVFVIFKFLAGMVVAQLLGPTLFGLRNALGIIVDHEAYAQAGTMEAMYKEVPNLRARGDQEGVAHVLSDVFSANLAQTLVVCVLAFAGAAWLHGTDIDRIYVDFLIYLGLHAVINRVAMYYEVLVVVDKRPNLLSQYRMLHAALSAVLSVVLVYFLSLRGLFIALILSHAAALGFLRYRVAWMPALGLSWARLVRLVRIGFPIMLITLLFMMFRSVDRVLVLWLLSADMLGHFAIGVIVSAIVFESIGDVLRVMFFPRFMERVGAGADHEELRSHLVDTTVLVACLVPFLMAGVYQAVHLPVVHLAPDFLPAIAVARILVQAQFFFAIATVPLLVAVAMSRQDVVVKLTLLAIALNATFTFVLVMLGFGIAGVAVGTGLSYAAFSLAVTTFALRLFDHNRMAALRLWALLLAPFTWSVLLLRTIEAVLPGAPAGIVADIALVALRFAVFCVLYAPLLWVMRAHPAFARLAALLPRGVLARVSRRTDRH